MFLAGHADRVGGEGLAGLTETLPGVSPGEMRSGKTITGVEQTERAAVGGLVRAARDTVGADGGVTVTVFVNPLQFGAGEDLDRYPRTLEADLELCAREGVDTVFAPDGTAVAIDGECACLPRARLDRILQQAAMDAGASFRAPFTLVQ